jgi:Mrp family chromosome partitioning ATPase
LADKQREKDLDEQDKRIKERLSKIRNIFLVMSGKGGVGKSTVAVNLAVSLAEMGNQVGLLDIDLHGPNALKMLGLEGRRIETDGTYMKPVSYSGNLKAVSIASLLEDSGTAVIWRGPLKIGVIKQFVADVNWGELDYLVIDSPPGTGDEPLTVAQSIPGAKGIIVTTPQEVSLMDARKSVDFCRQVKMPILGIIENMSGFICPHCGERVDIFSRGGGGHMAEELSLNLLGEIPIQKDIVTAGDSGKPFVLFDQAAEAKKAFASIVNSLVEEKK